MNERTYASRFRVCIFVFVFLYCDTDDRSSAADTCFVDLALSAEQQLCSQLLLVPFLYF